MAIATSMKAHINNKSFRFGVNKIKLPFLKPEAGRVYEIIVKGFIDEKTGTLVPLGDEAIK